MPQESREVWLQRAIVQASRSSRPAVADGFARRMSPFEGVIEWSPRPHISSDPRTRFVHAQTYDHSSCRLDASQRYFSLAPEVDMFTHSTRPGPSQSRDSRAGRLNLSGSPTRGVDFWRSANERRERLMTGAEFPLRSKWAPGSARREKNSGNYPAAQRQRRVAMVEPTSRAVHRDQGQDPIAQGRGVPAARYSSLGDRRCRGMRDSVTHAGAPGKVLSASGTTRRAGDVGAGNALHEATVEADARCIARTPLLARRAGRVFRRRALKRSAAIFRARIFRTREPRRVGARATGNNPRHGEHTRETPL